VNLWVLSAATINDKKSSAIDLCVSLRSSLDESINTFSALVSLLGQVDNPRRVCALLREIPLVKDLNGGGGKSGHYGGNRREVASKKT